MAGCVDGLSESFSQGENIVIERQILHQGSMGTQLFKKSSPPVQAPSKASPLSSLVNMAKKPKDPGVRWMRVELIKLHARLNAMRDSRLDPAAQQPKPPSRCELSPAARESTIHLLALHLTPLGEGNVRRPLGADGGIDIIIEDFDAEPKSPAPTKIIVHGSDCVYHLFPDPGRDMQKWLEKIESERSGALRNSITWKDAASPICMATRSTSSCSPRSGNKPALVAIARKTNKVPLVPRPRSGAISDPPEIPASLPASLQRPEQETTENYLKPRTCTARTAGVKSEVFSGSPRVAVPRHGHKTVPNCMHLGLDQSSLAFTDTLQTASARNSTALGSTALMTPAGLDNRTLYSLAQAVEKNPELLPDNEREYRLEGMWVSLDIDRTRLQREVHDPRIPGHSAMHKALRLIKEKLQKSGHADCAGKLTEALKFAGLNDLADIYVDLCSAEPADSDACSAAGGLLSPRQLPAEPAASVRRTPPERNPRRNSRGPS